MFFHCFNRGLPSKVTHGTVFVRTGYNKGLIVTTIRAFHLSRIWSMYLGEATQIQVYIKYRLYIEWLGWGSLMFQEFFGHNDLKNIGCTPEKLSWIGKGNSL